MNKNLIVFKGYSRSAHAIEQRQNFNQNGLSGFLIDNYKNTRTPIVLNGSNTIDFSMEKYNRVLCF